MNRTPLNPKLRGRYARMTASEMNAEVAALERPILLSETRPLTPSEKRQWQRAKRGPGRPRQGKGVRVISISVEQSLLQKADLAARRAGISRAALFAMGLKSLLETGGKLAG